MKKITQILFLIAVIAVLAGGFLFWFKNEIKEVFVKLSSIVASSNYVYAVHLNNGQLYFGNIKSISADTIVLKNAHILQMVQTQTNAPVSTSANFQVQPVNNNQQPVYGIAKRSEINKAMPTDNVLFIERRNVLFWEKLESSSDIVKLFEAEEKSSK
ncbi:hypothetical protein HZB04_00285 [Candidatus Wolfebacteria bacterium]|nr:hypothetical protein [Candidatus Wolfebacteria bacterium]